MWCGFIIKRYVKIFLALLGLSCAWWAHYLYRPLPDCPEPLVQMATRGAIQFIRDVSQMGEQWGYGNYSETYRKLVSTFYFYSNKRPLMEKAKVKNTKFAGVKVRIYKPVSVRGQGNIGVIFIHGGGWHMLDTDSYDNHLHILSKATEAVIVSIDYRLAPEHRFPAAFEDCLEASSFFLKNAITYGVDPGRIYLIGDDAGGNLAMAVAMKISKTTKKLQGLVLVTPILQAFDFQTPSHENYSDPEGPYLLTRQDVIRSWLLYAYGHEGLFPLFYNNTHVGFKLWTKIHHLYFRRQYLPRTEYFETYDELKQKAKEKKLHRYDNMDVQSIDLQGVSLKDIEKLIMNPYFCPLLAPDDLLTSLPNLYLMTAEHDPVRDEGLFLLSRLARLKHDYRHQHFANYDHSFINQLTYDASMATIAHISAFIHSTA